MPADGGLGLASLVLAMPGVIEVCIRYGEFLKERTHNYRHIDEIGRLYVLLVSLIEGELCELLKILVESVRNDTQEQQMRDVVYELHALLGRLTTKLPGQDPGKWEKLKFSFQGRRAIEAACKQLEMWEGMLFRRASILQWKRTGFGGSQGGDAFARSPYLASVQRTKLALPDTQSGQTAVSLQLPALGSNAALQRLGDSSVFLLHGRPELIEFRTYDSLSDTQDILAAREVATELAAKLRQADPIRMGLLQCTGVSNEEPDESFALHYQWPPNKTNPRTLRAILTTPGHTGKPSHSLSERLALAMKLASALLHVLACDFVHKNIRPDNILIFDPAVPDGVDATAHTSPAALGEPYLVGFDGARKATATSNMRRDPDWQKDIYRHPARHRMAAGDEAVARHDLYGLGVVLLELALWGSFTDEDAGGLGLRLGRVEDGCLVHLPPRLLQTKYLDMARAEVAQVLGDRYRDVVVSCLEGLRDEDGVGFLGDQNGGAVRDAYMSQVMSKLEQISV